METKFAPGPWQLRVDGVYLRVVHGEHKTTVADSIVSEANACLITAAPEGHEIIRQLEESFTADGTYQQFLPAMRAYLSKATGQQP